MARKAFIKPTKPSLIAGIIVTVLMFIFGIFFFSLIQGEPGSEIGSGFLIIWFIVLLIIGGSFVYNYINYDKNPSSSLAEEIQLGDEFLSSGKEISFDEKLRKLDTLKKENLISQTEYDQKREEIMKDKW